MGGAYENVMSRERVLRDADGRISENSLRIIVIIRGRVFESFVYKRLRRL